jgi:hypothetical protein
MVAHVTRGFRVKAHLLAYIRRHHQVLLPSALVPQKQVGIYLGPTDPEGGKAPLRVPRYANLIWVDVRPPNLVLEQVGDVQADIARPLPEPVAHIKCARVKGIGPIVIDHGDQISTRRKIFAEPG